MATQAAIIQRWRAKAKEIISIVIRSESDLWAETKIIEALQSAYEQGLGAGIDSIEQRKQDRDSQHG